jgi:CRISPR-associated protein Csx3
MERRWTMKGVKIILAGPPRSGKSCLREGLKKAILDLVRARQIDLYPYVITACPDGEGAWFQETAARSPDEARQLKIEYKKSLGGFTPEFVKRVAESVRLCNLPLTLVDIGGYPSRENEEICKNATHAILLAGDTDDESWSQRLEVWRAFCQKVGLRIIAELHSDYHGREDSIQGIGPDGIFRGSIHHLERGEDISQRPCVVALAEYLVKLVTSEV